MLTSYAASQIVRSKRPLAASRAYRPPQSKGFALQRASSYTAVAFVRPYPVTTYEVHTSCGLVDRVRISGIRCDDRISFTEYATVIPTLSAFHIKDRSG